MQIASAMYYKFIKMTKKKLIFLNRYLTLWIFISIITGIQTGYIFTAFPKIIISFNSGTTNILITIGLILMMYFPLAKVDYTLLLKVFRNIRALFISYSVKTPRDIIYKNELEPIKKSNKNFDYIITITRAEEHYN